MAGEATATNQSYTAGERRGLTSAEARARLARFGPNAVAERKANPLLAILAKFWAPAATVGAALGICVLFLAALDFVKVPALRRMR